MQIEKTVTIHMTEEDIRTALAAHCALYMPTGHRAPTLSDVELTCQETEAGFDIEATVTVAESEDNG